MSTLTNLKSNQAINLAFSEEKMTVFMEDGREIGNGKGIHWEDLDEDLLVSALVS